MLSCQVWGRATALGSKMVASSSSFVLNSRQQCEELIRLRRTGVCTPSSEYRLRNEDK
jgi:hypothetical protein